METKHVYNSYNREEREGVLSLPYPQDLWIRYISSENGGMQPFFLFIIKPSTPSPHTINRKKLMIVFLFCLNYSFCQEICGKYKNTE